jgi:hypothetical protein
MLIFIRRFESERNPPEREHEGGRGYESGYRPEREVRESRYSPEREREERKRKFEIEDVDMASKRRKDVCYRCGGVLTFLPTRVVVLT